MAGVKPVGSVVHEGGLPIPFDGRALSGICARHAVRELALFGSVLREDFTPESDVDVLVAYRTGAHPSLLEQGALVADLERLFGRSVDLVSADSLRPFLRDEILSTRREVYVETSSEE